MKNKVFKYLAIALLSVAFSSFFASCDDEGLTRRQEPKIEIQDDVLTGPLADRKVVNLKSSYPWFAEASDSWIVLQRYRGQALMQDSMVVEIEENSGMEAREGYIDIRLMDQLTKRILVKQGGRGSLITLLKSTVYFNINGGEMIIDVLTDLDWQTNITSENGFTLSKVDKNKLKIVAGKNNTGANREIKVKISDANNTVKADLTVIQTNIEKMLSITLAPKDKDILINKTGSLIQIPVTLNLAYDCVASDNWIKIEKAPQIEGTQVQDVQIEASVGLNDSGEERSGYIVIRNKGAVTDASDTLFVSQRAKKQIIYVKLGSAGDGTSWERAFGSIEQGMAAASNEGDMDIWVSSGEYKLQTTLTWRAVNVYGGFKGMETKLKDRDLTKKSCIVGGAFITISAWGTSKLTNPEAYYYLDGFEITGANNPTNSYMGSLEIYDHMSLRNCVVHGNTYGKSAGGYFQNTKLINCVFYDNHTTLYASSMQALATNLYNVTVVNNDSKGSGGGIRFNTSKDCGNRPCEVYNSIFWGNKHLAGNIHQVYLDANGTAKFVNSAIQGGFSSTNGKPASTVGCISLDADNEGGPKFINTTLGNEDFGLKAGSPCIDAGLNDPIKEIGLLIDIIGRNRYVGVADMGAYEYIK